MSSPRIIPTKTSCPGIPGNRLVEEFPESVRHAGSRLESGPTLLDNTSLLSGSNLGNAHHARNSKKNTPLCDLFVTMLNNAGLQTESFGQSRGSLTW